MNASGFQHVNVVAGEGCEISPHASLENVVLGRGVTVRDGAQLKNVIAGDFCRFSRNVTLYSPDESRPVRIGKSCWFSHGVLGEGTGAEIAIGDYVVIAHGTTLLTSSGPGTISPLMNILYPVECAPIALGRHCWIGAQCVLLPGARLEEGVVLGANSMAPGKLLEAWSVYAGSPATMRKRIDPARVQEARMALSKEGVEV